MLKTTTAFFLASIAFASSTFANDNVQSTGNINPEAFAAQLSSDANQKQIRRLLAGQGYIVTSELVRDESGRWTGTALKDGKVVNVALKLPVKASSSSFTN